MPSAKSNLLVAWESQLEYLGCLAFEHAPQIERLKDQPATFKYDAPGRRRKYTPDFRLDLIDGTHAYIEIKPTSKLTAEEMARLEAIRQHLEVLGERFLLITDDDLPQGRVVKSNLQLLSTYLRQPVTESDTKKVLELVALKGEVTARAASQACESVGIVYALIARRLLAVDLNKAITPKSTISLFKGQDHATPQFFYRSGAHFSERQLFGREGP